MRQDEINKNKWYADNGKFFRRISDHNIVGDFLILGVVNYINGVKLCLPKQEVINDYEEIDNDVIKAEEDYNDKIKRLKYCEFVNNKIRERYTLSEELAIQRKRDTSSDEFKDYYDYCESCKEEAKKIYYEQ